MGVASSDQEPFIVPLSIPGMAGPSSMATVMLLAAQAPNHLGQMVGALSVVMATTGVILYFADVVQRRLGDRFTVCDGAFDGDDFGRGVGADVAHGGECVLAEFALNCIL